MSSSSSHPSATAATQSPCLSHDPGRVKYNEPSLPVVKICVERAHKLFRRRQPFVQVQDRIWCISRLRTSIKPEWMPVMGQRAEQDSGKKTKLGRYLT